MFIVSLTYTKSLTVIDTLLEAHKNYLKKHYKAGNFIASGRKVPRTGGIIMSDLACKETLMNILKEDPFFKNEVADYDVIEFEPSMTSEKLKHLIPA